MDYEMIWCLISLYLSAVFYMALALYLYQVVPQTYGVPKRWDFLWNESNKKKAGRNRDTDEIGDLELEREQKE
jgi:hypothetical protein